MYHLKIYYFYTNGCLFVFMREETKISNFGVFVDRVGSKKTPGHFTYHTERIETCFLCVKIVHTNKILLPENGVPGAETT